MISVWEGGILYTGTCKISISICYLDLVLPFAPSFGSPQNDLHYDELGIARLGILPELLPWPRGCGVMQKVALLDDLPQFAKACTRRWLALPKLCTL